MNVILRRAIMVSALLLLTAYAVAVARGPNGVTALAARRQQIRELQEKNASLEADNKRKRERIELLRHDRDTLDLEIREKLGLVRPGEQQVVVEGNEAPAPPPAAPPKQP